MKKKHLVKKRERKIQLRTNVNSAQLKSSPFDLNTSMSEKVAPDFFNNKETSHLISQARRQCHP